jgi:hypothetical protein
MNHQLTVDFETATAATNYRFVNCIVHVPGTEVISFENLDLENTTFVETTEQVYALNTLTVDLYSASALRFLTANHTVLNFEKSFWPVPRPLSASASSSRRAA